MTSVERETPTPGFVPPEQGISCPELSRFWDVALGGSWASDERQHVASCPRCQVTERTTASAVCGVSAERGPAALSLLQNESVAQNDHSSGDESVDQTLQDIGTTGTSLDS